MRLAVGGLGVLEGSFGLTESVQTGNGTAGSTRGVPIVLRLVTTARLNERIPQGSGVTRVGDGGATGELAVR